ncbi:MAG: hypothetical protein KKD01_03610 [Proteobacteria bacterium]|nr:hypothetical protein [Pseudomonadota bacterium]MBU1417096.1 hypothetical protein [Pseudomonadota bacterium]MBU1453792.1 hypothetical protein [Pseudomonadota bacterium]
MDTIVNVMLEHKLYVCLGLLVLLGLLALTSATLRGQLKKGIILLLIVAGLGGGYYFFTGKSPSDIPGVIDKFFNNPTTEKEPSHRYYKDPEERYGDQMKKL